MNMLFERPRQFARLIFIIMVIPGILLWIDFVRTPSEIEGQFLFGFSKLRLTAVLFFSFLLILNISAVIWTNIKPRKWQTVIENRLVSRTTRYPVQAYVILCLAALASGVSLLMIIPPVIRNFAFFEPIGTQVGEIIFWVFLASSLLAVFIRTTCQKYFHESRVPRYFDRFLLLAGLFLIVFFLYEHLLIWMGGANQSRYSYWNLLADEFLRGRLYLPNPSQTHDLTLFNGKWYVPMPPLPAILMMPLAFLIGGENISTSDFSILISALNAVLVYLTLDQLVRQKWIRLTQIGLLVFVALFAFGTPHLWVGIRGRAWFVSQIVTVTFLTLAVYAALKSWPPWLAGICIGLAITARPNSVMTWPFVFAIAMQIMKEKQGGVSPKQMLGWSLQSALPMAAAVGCLLLYNFARFEDYLDFGYVTISGDPMIVANAQKYGIFSPHYIPANLKAMFLSFPAIQPGGRWPILPSATGMSIFLTTPPLIYLFHRFEHRWWVIGAWSSVFLNFILLVLYHNTGAHQFGYRYILDIIIPLLAMLAVAIGDRIRWHFILLVIVSIAFNVYGAYWFING